MIGARGLEGKENDPRVVNPRAVQQQDPLPFFHTASKMQKLGWVLVAVGILVAVAALVGCLQIRKMPFYRPGDVVALATCASGLTLAFFGVGTFLLRKDYWDDPRYAAEHRNEGQPLRADREARRDARAQKKVQRDFDASKASLEKFNAFIMLHKGSAHLPKKEIREWLAEHLISHNITDFVDGGGYDACAEAGLLDGLKPEQLDCVRKLADSYSQIKGQWQQNAAEKEGEFERGRSRINAEWSAFCRGDPIEGKRSRQSSIDTKSDSQPGRGHSRQSSVESSIVSVA